MLPWIKHLEMRMRALVPDPVKGIVRAARALASPQEFSPAMPAELLVDCRMCASREDLLDRLPKGGVVAELGT